MHIFYTFCKASDTAHRKQLPKNADVHHHDVRDSDSSNYTNGSSSSSSFLSVEASMPRVTGRNAGEGHVPPTREPTLHQTLRNTKLRYKM